VSFGAIAVRLGLLTSDQILEAAEIQAQMRERGVAPKRLGEILVERGYLTDQDVRRIFRVQGIKGGHTQIAGYKLLHKIGRGAMGTVYKALQCSMDRVVALKILPPALAENQKFVERFFREAKAVARLSHVNIVQGIDVGESNGVHYFVMEYLDGIPLGTTLKRGGALEEKRALTITLQVAQALVHAHLHGLVHRDIKPDNIMLTRSGVVKLCDLGLAKMQSRSRTPAADATGNGAAMGTPNYISPEQARGEAGVDTRADIYCLGGTLYHMLTGQVPFPLENAMEVVSRHLTELPPRPRELSPTVSPEVDWLVMKMLAKKQEDRHQTPSELVADLEAILECRRPAAFAAAPARPEPLRTPATSRHRIGGASSYRYLARKRRFGR
ncbi:MAG: protein kinase, partial [Planctomycetes bacterium]|nr:protein kinase [Planctomycetota bacterium]